MNPAVIMGPGQLVVGAATPADSSGPYKPHPALPSKPALDYLKVGIELLLLLLAVPWIVRELARNPGRVSKRAASKHLTGS